MKCTGDLCDVCGSAFRMAWLMGDPPEPYGERCSCPDEDYEDAKAEKRAMDQE